MKWAGGKRQLVERLASRMPRNYNRYFEPFVGGGALLFHLNPTDASINDVNKELINTYLQIKSNKDDIISNVFELDNVTCDKDYYLSIRERYNIKIVNNEYDIEMAALFIFLNKHCFNGLYRVNKKGLFNVPWNNKEAGSSVNIENIQNISAYLQSVKITSGDFEDSIKDAKQGDFIFFDSPYAPLKDTSFESYTKERFSKDEHIRLANLYKDLTNRGCHCMLTNHNTGFINDLYKDFAMEVVDVKRFINSNANNRTGKEVIIRNYE